MEHAQYKFQIIKLYIYIYIYIYNNVTSILCAFSLVVDRDLLKDTHRDDVKPRHITSADLFFFFMPQNPSINHLNFYCIKQIYNIFPCVCTHVIDHRRRHSVFKKQQSRHSTSSRVVLFVLYTL